MGKLEKWINGKFITLIITILGAVLTFAITMYTVGQQTGQYKEKVDTLEKTTVPHLDKKIDTNMAKIESNTAKIEEYMKEIRGYFKNIDSTQIERKYIQIDINKRVKKIEKKLKLNGD